MDGATDDIAACEIVIKDYKRTLVIFKVFYKYLKVIFGFVEKIS